MEVMKCLWNADMCRDMPLRIFCGGPGDTDVGVFLPECRIELASMFGKRGCFESGLEMECYV